MVCLGKADHLAMFGRPLWTAFTGDAAYMDDLAKRKLLGGKRPARYVPSSRDEAFAVISFRLMLDVCSQIPKTYAFSRKAVDSHMLVVTGMRQTRGIIYTLTPSEPVLAIAAMALLRPTDTWARSIRTLNSELLGKGLVDKETKGELFARLLVVLARDAIPSALPPAPMPLFTVRDFLQQLFDARFHASLERVDASVLNALLNFTHFTATAENLAEDEMADLLLDLLRRGAALQLAPKQPLYDLLLPMCLGPATAPVDRRRCGACVFQIKYRGSATTPDSVFQEDFQHFRLPPRQPGGGRGSGGGSSSAATTTTTTKPRYAPERSRRRLPKQFAFGTLSVPVLFVMLDVGASAMSTRTTAAAAAVKVSCSMDAASSQGAATAVMAKAKLLPPPVWAVHARGPEAHIFRCLATWDCVDEVERFFDDTVPSGDEVVDESMISRLEIFRRIQRDWRDPIFDDEVVEDEDDEQMEERPEGDHGSCDASEETQKQVESASGIHQGLVFRKRG